ncbi:MAG: dTDP-4-dehydrorhamnose 3,5-epimerase family protein [Rhodospirillaceae bacterium]|nr:dTDP-4-dehydrorhamnose 3,5-epimerase family protein [Rhodospirillaceae bacterium]
MLEGAVKDVATVSSGGDLLFDPIAGVQVRELRNQFTRVGGTTTEFYCYDWFDPPVAIRQMVHVVMQPGVVSAWHFHAKQTDVLVVTNGVLRIALFDDREGSPTRGKVNALTIGPLRPRAVVIPPKLWHGVQNPSGEVSSFVNATDMIFEHGDPDDWRVPPDHPQIPYRFA